ncbi:MAG: cytochrome C [Planctomycetota bacterium]|jgi:formate-dependent nitrite reductase cytochrome c552 subunit
MEHSKHIIRAVLLLILIAVVFVVVRHFLIPRSFGDYGHYRSDSIAEIAARPLAHGGPQACVECHAEDTEWVLAEEHGSVACEVCHAPLVTHVVGGEKIADMRVRRTTELCAWCHQRLAARPATFPQVNLVEHVTQREVEFTEDVCWSCHEIAHDPIE